jgi:hypothetical protein
MNKKPAVASTAAITSVQPQSSSIPAINVEDEKGEQLLQRKIILTTEGFCYNQVS